MSTHQSRQPTKDLIRWLLSFGGLVMVLLFALLVMSAPAALAAGKPDGSSCTSDSNCTGGICVKTSSTAKFGLCCTKTNNGVEICDGKDNDCDAAVDEGVTSIFYRDQDTDTYGNPTVTTQACSAPAGYVANNADCNDTNSAIRPGAAEICDGVDNNCNGQTDESVTSTFYPDQDLDTYGSATGGVQGCSAPAGYVANNTDCNDSDTRIHPGVAEVCDNRDNNCNGQIDEGLARTF